MTEEFIFLTVDYSEFEPETYRSVTILKKDNIGNIIFNTGNFVNDFNAALAKGIEISTEEDIHTPDTSDILYNSRGSNLMFLSTCDNFMADSDGKYRYVYSEPKDNEEESYEIIGVEETK